MGSNVGKPDRHDIAPSSREPRREVLVRRFSCAALALAVVICFSPAFAASFVSWDDLDNLIKNTRWRGLGPAELKWMFTSFHLGHYQPLTWLSFAVDHALWDLEPSGYHATNILIHAANAVLFFLLARRLIHIGVAGADPALGAPARVDLTLSAAFAAALWALHPLRVESVAWVTERRDVLSTLFLLLAALAYLSAVEPGAPRVHSRRAYWLAVVMLLLSCLSKAWGMSFFVLLLALDVYPLRRLPANPLRWFSRDSARVLVEKSPMVVIGVATAVLAANAQHAGQATKSLSEWPLASRVSQSLYGLSFYLEKSIAPTDLAPLYQLPAKLNPLEPRFLGAYFLVAAVGIGLLLALRRSRAPALPAAIAIYTVMLAPVLGILQSGEQLVADRYSYIATMPVAVLTAIAGLWAYNRIRAGRALAASRVGPLLGPVAAIPVVSLGALSFAQTTIWHDSLSLWEHAVAVAPCSASYDYLGDELLRQDRPNNAADAYQQAAELSPRDGRAWFCLANVLKDQGHTDEAEHAYVEATKCLSVAYQAYQNLGLMYLGMGRKDDAYRQFELAVADLEDQSKGTRPLSGGPYMVLGLARKDQGRLDEAAALFRKAVPFQDTHEDALRQLQALGRS
jgi:tetratricopeptide (TPR) repeat protein